MRDLADSAWLFTRGIVGRAYIWLFGFVLDPLDLYTRFIVPAFPGLPVFEVPDPWPWVILAALVFWCGVLTYHEVRQVADREGRPDMPLRDAVTYLRKKAKWADQFDNYDGWAEATVDCLHDLFRLGHLTVWGRPKVSRERSALGPMRPIDPEYWETQQLNVISLLSPTEPAAQTWDVWKTLGPMYDLHVSRAHVCQEFPRKGFWRRGVSEWAKDA